MNEDDPDWLKLRYLPLPKVLEQFLKELKMTPKNFQTSSQAQSNGMIYKSLRNQCFLSMLWDLLLFILFYFTIAFFPGLILPLECLLLGVIFVSKKFYCLGLFCLLKVCYIQFLVNDYFNAFFTLKFYLFINFFYFKGFSFFHSFNHYSFHTYENQQLMCHFTLEFLQHPVGFIAI
jgi:hypothetical protein